MPRLSETRSTAIPPIVSTRLETWPELATMAWSIFTVVPIRKSKAAGIGLN